MSNPMQMNGAACLAVKGNQCVSLATDLRFGQQLLTLGTNFSKIHKVNSKVLVAFPGLATDTQQLMQLLKYHTNIYSLEHHREITAKECANLISHLLYEKRFGPYFVEPIVCGFDADNQPFICSMDVIGCINYANDFVVGGTAEHSLFGMAENLVSDNLNPDELFECTSQCMLNGVDRDAFSGWGVEVIIL
eukprot:NODE_177_length_14091_cov_0.996141.p8 type:complete len:191 gc:universal NODE_177_length_14091_cov_0.996141:8094-8666(+)